MATTKVAIQRILDSIEADRKKPVEMRRKELLAQGVIDNNGNVLVRGPKPIGNGDKILTDR